MHHWDSLGNHQRGSVGWNFFHPSGIGDLAASHSIIFLVGEKLLSQVDHLGKIDVKPGCSFRQLDSVNPRIRSAAKVDHHSVFIRHDELFRPVVELFGTDHIYDVSVGTVLTDIDSHLLYDAVCQTIAENGIAGAIVQCLCTEGDEERLLFGRELGWV